MDITNILLADEDERMLFAETSDELKFGVNLTDVIDGEQLMLINWRKDG